MALVTGTPLGSITASEDIYLTGAPTIYIQRSEATVLKNPDSMGFYWGLSGTTAYPVYEVGCLTAVNLTENLSVQDVLCDNVGMKATVQSRNYLEFNFTLQSFFPFDTLVHLMKGGGFTETAPNQAFGLGTINNNLFWHVYAPKVYDDSVGDYVVIHLHKAQFVDAFTLNMPFTSQWQLTGVKLRAFADTTKPSTALFGTILRSDLSAV
jgi:hypothetical protein